jgi:hypothetical protein
MAVLDFKPRTPITGSASATRAPKRRNVTVQLAETAGCGKLPYFPSEGHYLATMTIDGRRIQADDGHMLGMAAWLSNVKSLQFASPSFPAGVPLTGIGDLPKPFLDLRSRLESQRLRGVKREKGWAEYWFASRLHTVLNTARRSKSMPVSLLEGWEQNSLPTAKTLVPPELHVHARFPRAPAYDEKGMPLSAAAVSKGARDKRFMDAFASGVPAYAINIPWEYITRCKDPLDPVAINGPAFLAVQQMLKKLAFPRMPESYAELKAVFDFCKEVNMTVTPPFPGLPDIGWAAAYLETRQEFFADTQELFAACVAGDMGVVERLQASKDWLPVIATYYVDEDDCVRGRRTS